MTGSPQSLGDLGFDPEAIRLKYLKESEKRQPAEQTPSQTVASSTTVSVEDPFADPGFERVPLSDEVDVVVVGGGLTGLIAGTHLREAGVPRVRLIEKAAGFGGVWYWNRYPGIRCDVDAYTYMPRLEEVGTMPSEKFASGDEIRAHCLALAERFGLDEAACLQTQVTGMRWDAAASRWIVQTDRGDEIRARFVCLGSGTLDVPSIPAAPGLDSFEGHVFHSSRWDYNYTGGDANGGLVNLEGKRVAVVGTAASGIQFIPHLAEYAGQVIVFQRTPVVVVPRGNHPTDADWFRGLPKGWQRERMENLTAVVQSPPGQRPPGLDLVNDALTNLTKWTRNPPPEFADKIKDADRGTQMLLSNYWAMEKIRADMASLVDDPETAEAIKPYYNLGCKRPQFSDNYLQAYNRPNVTLVNTQGHGIERLTSKGVVYDGVEYEVDCVIFATGFAVDTGRFPVVGRGGLLLSDKWRDGVRSLHGILSAGFPNLFVIGGIPQAAHTVNFTHMLEQQGAYVAKLVGRCLADGIESIEVRLAAEEAWAEQIRSRAETLPRVSLGCAPDSVMDLIRAGYPGGPVEYMQICREWLADGFERDLVIEHTTEKQPA
jgi:cation diffusion facilitator CzcD-associated flavoprotein CzcO